MLSCESSEYEKILLGTKGTSVTAWWDRAADLILGIAMGNAGDEVKAVADATCKNVEDDGIYYYCVENGLIEPIQA